MFDPVYKQTFTFTKQLKGTQVKQKITLQDALDFECSSLERNLWRLFGTNCHWGHRELIDWFGRPDFDTIGESSSFIAGLDLAPGILRCDPASNITGLDPSTRNTRLDIFSDIPDSSWSSGRLTLSPSNDPPWLDSTFNARLSGRHPCISAWFSPKERSHLSQFLGGSTLLPSFDLPGSDPVFNARLSEGMPRIRATFLPEETRYLLRSESLARRSFDNTGGEKASFEESFSSAHCDIPGPDAQSGSSSSEGHSVEVPPLLTATSQDLIPEERIVRQKGTSMEVLPRVITQGQAMILELEPVHRETTWELKGNRRMREFSRLEPMGQDS